MTIQGLSGVPNIREPITESSGRIVTRAWFYFFQVIFNRTVPVGAILQFAGVTPPSGFLPTDGQAVSRNVFSNLFAVIGVSFGAGDGSTTFNVPSIAPVGGVLSMIKT